MNETDLASTVIRNQIDAYDQAAERVEQQTQVEIFTANSEQEQASTSEFKRIVFGSKQHSITLASMEELSTTDSAFQNIRTKINRALSRILGSSQRVSVTPEQEVSSIFN